MKLYITLTLEIITIFLILIGLLISPTIIYISLLPLLLAIIINLTEHKECK